MSTVALTEAAMTEALHGSAVREWSGPAPKRIVTGYGFWIFILSDMVMFSAFFAPYVGLLGPTAGGPARARGGTRSRAWFPLARAVTCALGLGFLILGGREFASLVVRGAGPTRSA